MKIKIGGTYIPLFLVSLYALWSFVGQAQIRVLPNLPIDKIVPDAITDLSSFQKDQKQIKKAVQWLFDNDKLDHEMSKAYDPKATFEVYWKTFSASWFAMDMDRDKQLELVFSGQSILSDEKEYFHLFRYEQKAWKQVFWEEGHILAYLLHPNTKEIILIHHKYPCCYSASHNINHLRLIKGELRQEKKLLLARDTGMLGNYFPDKIDYDTQVYRLPKEEPLYWSSEKITEKAFAYSETNVITLFDKGAEYQILAKRGAWKYVMMLTPPPTNKPSRVINPLNLIETRLIGWFYLP